ncbi:MAG: hypothetical protein JRE28_14065 [Deltaproteobacteria bacterium]|nr:hypothetical protein [Deltaproteobacteria bacterium]
MFNENNCLENLKHIVSEYAGDENIKNLSLDELRPSYANIADNMFCISVSNRLKYKNMLWNIDHLKPEIRSIFQTELFNTWHSIYIRSAKAGPAEDHPEIKKQESTPVLEPEKALEVDEKEQASGITDQQSVEGENQKRTVSGEDTYPSREMKPAKEQSPIPVPTASVHKYENDWFDKLLDFFAVIVGGVSKIVGR